MVVITAAESDKRLGRMLGGSGLSVLYADTSSACFYGGGPDLIFVSRHELQSVKCENAAIIVRSAAGLPESIDCKNVVAIVDSSDRELLAQVGRRHLRALTCGLARSDTFTLSSLTSDSAVISLQRSITAFDGSIVEPFELPVAFAYRVEPFSLLACAAIFSLTGLQSPFCGAARWTLPPS